MTTEEIRELIAGLGVKISALADLQRRTEEELRQSSLEVDQQLKETDQQLKETDQQVKETGQQLKETGQQLKETDKRLRELGVQLGGLGEKFGSFTEGLALPSMTKLLEKRFHMDVISARVRARHNGSSMEIDVLAYSNSRFNEVYVVEVKSHLREEGFDRMKEILRDFREFFPSHHDKKLYGILAVVDVPAELRSRVLREGIYLARIHDDEFELDVPTDFEPRAF